MGGCEGGREGKSGWGGVGGTVEGREEKGVVRLEGLMGEWEERGGGWGEMKVWTRSCGGGWVFGHLPMAKAGLTE